MNKIQAGMIGIAVFLVGAFAICMQFAHKLENQNLAIVQSMSGDVDVRRTSGWWIQVCPTITEYPKAGIYQLNAKDHDLLDIQFNNKTTAKLRANIGYRIDSASDETIISLHQQVEGDENKVWIMMLTALNTIAQSITTKYDPSEVIGGEKFEVMVREMHGAIIHNKELMTHGIDVNYFAVDGRPIPDEATAAQFAKQKDADLSKRLAMAEKVKFEAEKIKVEAEYAKKMSEQEGIAKAQMAKEVQDAERQKKLAEIEASKKVEIEKLAKEELMVKMNKEKEAATIEIQKQKEVAKIEAEKLREVAEIQKATEAAKLEAVKMISEQKKASAEAKKIEIEKSGAITEVERAKIDLELGIAKAKWENIGKGISGLKLPQMMTIGNGSGQSQNPLDTLIQTMTLEKLNSVNNVK